MLRLDAARARLSAHHSAPFGGMHRRGGGGKGGFGVGGNGGASGAQAARQFFLSLFDGAVANRGRSPLARRPGGGGRQSAASRPREGEWQCICGFETNRPARESCHRCGRSRDTAEVGCKGGARRWGGEGGGQKGRPGGKLGGGSWGYSGPVGAGGSRPLLGGRGQDEQACPRTKGGGKDPPRAQAWNGKGPTAASTYASAGGGKGAKGDRGVGGPTVPGTGNSSQANAVASPPNHGDSRTTWGKPRAVVDEEGYQLVQPRRVRTECSNFDGSAPTYTGSPPAAVPTRRRWSDEVSDDGDGGGDDDYCLDGDIGAQGNDDWDNDPKRLRAAYEEHARAVKSMERAGGFGPALETMRGARDEAERRWREAKSPAPLSKRLAWAETKLQRAQSTLERARLQLEQFDEEANRRRAELCERIHEAEGWCSWRREQLEGLHSEAAEGAADKGTGAAAAGGGNPEVRQTLRVQVLPEMQSILEAVQGQADLHERLSMVFTNLANAEVRLAAPEDEGDADRYDLYDGDTGDEDWDGDEGMHEDPPAGGGDGDRCEGPVEDGSRRGSSAWRPEGQGPGRWTRTSGSGGKGAHTTPNDTGTGATQTTGRGPTTPGIGDGVGAAEDGTGARDMGGPATNNEDSEGARAGKHRRRQTDEEREAEARKASDDKRAQELLAQLEQASAAQQQSFQEGAGGFGSEVALSWAAQKFVLDVQRTQAQANELGVEPKASDGRSLLQLSPMELKQWAEQHLGDGRTGD